MSLETGVAIVVVTGAEIEAETDHEIESGTANAIVGTSGIMSETSPRIVKIDMKAGS